jgi:L-alanine-DL-glutamate epimerase-like enolase superfamily enzyme
LRTILELKSDDGIVGIAETYGGEAPAAALENFGRGWIGADPFKSPGH